MLIAYLLLVAVLTLVLFTSLSAAPWVPTRKFDVEALLNDAKITKGIHYVELGCGDGRLVKASARRGAKAVGYELNPLLFIVAWVSTLNTPNAKIVFKNFWNVDLSKADVVMAFIMPRTLPRLDNKLAQELKPSAILVSYIFPVEGRKAIKRGKSWHIYRYKK